MGKDLVNRKKCDNEVHKVRFFRGPVRDTCMGVYHRSWIHTCMRSTRAGPLKYKFVRTADKTNNNSTRDAIFHTPEVNNYSLHMNNYHSLTGQLNRISTYNFISALYSRLRSNVI